MTTERDMDDEMNRSGFDDLTADRLLSGQVAPQDAPPEYQLIADAVRRASDPGSPTDSERERAIVAAMVETLRSAPSAYQPARRIAKARMRGVKVAAIAAAVLISATAAGAATNTLPGPAQRAISDAASHVGLSLPKPSAPHGGPGRAGKPVGPDAAAHAKYGLCSAYAAGPSTTNPRSRKGGSVAFANLKRAADGAGMSIADYCKNAAPPTGKSGRAPETDTTLPHGAHPTAPVSTPHSTGPPVSTPHSTGPPVSTPHTTGPPVSTPHTTGPRVSTRHSTGPPVSTPGDAHRP